MPSSSIVDVIEVPLASTSKSMVFLPPKLMLSPSLRVGVIVSLLPVSAHVPVTGNTTVMVKVLSAFSSRAKVPSMAMAIFFSSSDLILSPEIDDLAVSAFQLPRIFFFKVLAAPGKDEYYEQTCGK